MAVIVNMGFVNVLDLELLVRRVQMAYCRMVVLVLVSHGKMLPLVSLTGGSVMSNMRVAVGVFDSIVTMERKFIRFPLLSLSLHSRDMRSFFLHDQTSLCWKPHNVKTNVSLCLLLPCLGGVVVSLLGSARREAELTIPEPWPPHG